MDGEADLQTAVTDGSASEKGPRTNDQDNNKTRKSKKSEKEKLAHAVKKANIQKKTIKEYEVQMKKSNEARVSVEENLREIMRMNRGKRKRGESPQKRHSGPVKYTHKSGPLFSSPPSLSTPNQDR